MKMLDALDKGKSPIIYGDGNESFDFISTYDCAQANICAMKTDTVDEFYNVGTGKKTSLKELAQILIKLRNSKKEINYKKSSQATLVKNRIGCTKKASNDLHVVSKIKLNDGLKKLIKWRDNMKNNNLNV